MMTSLCWRVQWDMAVRKHRFLKIFVYFLILISEKYLLLKCQQQNWT